MLFQGAQKLFGMASRLKDVRSNHVELCGVFRFFNPDMFPSAIFLLAALAQMSECAKVITLGEAMAYVLSDMYGPVKASGQVGTVGSQLFILVFGIDNRLGDRTWGLEMLSSSSSNCSALESLHLDDI